MKQLVIFVIVIGVLTGCALSSSTGDDAPRVVVVTATFAPLPPTPIPATATPLPPVQIASVPTANSARFDAQVNRADQHIVQSGDTLYGIARLYGTSLESLVAANDLIDPNALTVGQVIALPGIPDQQTPNVKLLPDARLVRGPGSAQFDIDAFIAAQPGFINRVADTVDTRQADGSVLEERLTAAQIVERVSLEYSVDARMLLAVLELSANWLSDPDPPALAKARPFDVDRDGFYRQLAWAANMLNMGYYGWKYRGLATLEFSGTERYLYAPGLNAGTVAVQYLLSTQFEPSLWAQMVSGESRFLRLYVAYFGDPFANVVDPLVPQNLVQPEMGLPFGAGEVWFFTGGAHGGWASGSAWAAIDFAPPDERDDGRLCYTSDYWVRAVAAGVIARSDGGAVVLDLDGDGDESTGWTVFYLHLAAQDRVAVGTTVNVGDPIGRASCEGGFSTATHLHIGRRYNGEWLPADCFVCAPFDARPPLNLGGWVTVGIRNQEYQGFLAREGERRTAEQGRLSLVNRISW